MAKDKRVAPKAKTARATRAPIALGAAWAAALLGLLVVLFFHDLVFGGKTFVSADATNPVGFVRVGEQSLYRDHIYPLWNPYVFLGMPSFASGAYNPLIYPPDWPLGLVQKVLPLPDMTWLLLYYFLGGFFFFLLAREWGARPEGAILGGAAFAFAPNLIAVGSHGHGSQLVDSAYLPLMLWLATRWIRRGRLADLAWLALAGGFQLLRGHVQICFYTWLAIALYVVVEIVASVRGGRLRPTLVRAAGIGGAMVLAFGLAAFYSLPLRDYARYSIRGGGEGGGVGMSYATQWSLGWAELPTLILPNWMGFGGNTYFGTMPFTDYPNAYIGIVAALLLLPAFFVGGVPRVFALVLGLFALLVSFGKNFPLYGVLYDHLPLFNKFRIPVMIILLFHAATALGVAWGWTRLIEGSGAKKTSADPVDRVLFAAAFALVVLLVASNVSRESWHQNFVLHAREAIMGRVQQMLDQGGLQVVSELAEQGYRGFAGDFGRVCLLGLVTIAIAFAARRRWLPAGLASLVMLGLLLADLWPIGGRLAQPVIGPRVERPLDEGRDDVIEFLEKAGPPGTFRIFPMNEFQSNRFAGYMIGSAGGYHAAKPKLVQDLISRQLVMAWPWARVLNLRYVVAEGHITDAPPDLKEVFNGTQVIYENQAALPRATLVGQYQVVQPDSAILDSVLRGGHDPATITYLTEDPKLVLGPVEGGTAEIASYRLNDVVVDTNSPGPALLRLADQWYPDWIATVDGRPAPILRADYLLRAVPVPAGRHRVEFHFRPRVVRLGLWISILSLALVLGLLAFDLTRRRNPRTTTVGAG